MNKLVIYKSKTGFTKEYAGHIAQAVGAQLMPLCDVSQVVMDRFETVIFGGGLYAGRINGLEKLKKLYCSSTATRLVVFACGATPNEAAGAIESMWKQNFTDMELSAVPHFYMQGGLAYEKMSPADRFAMKAVAKLKGSRALEASHDISSEKYAEPLIELVRKL